MTDLLQRHAERAGFALVQADLAFDAEYDRPRLVRAVERRCPPIRTILAGLRRRLPVARNASEGVTGQFYRLPGHYRLVCCAIPDLTGPERLWEGDVVALEGTEPLMADFDDYLRWMLTTPFRDGDLPIGLHLPLVAGIPPGAVPLDECNQAQRLAAALHERHLTLYGELAQAPVPLVVHRFSAEDTASYIETLRWRLPLQAFERAEARARTGCGVSVWYYPAAPIRVDDLRVLAAADPRLRAAPEAGEETIAGWCRQFARLLHLGFMPFAPWNAGRGSCVDAGSACIDGGFADLSTLVPFESIPDDRWFRRSLLDSIGRLSYTVSVFAASLGDRPAGPPDPSLDAMTRVFLGPRLLQHLETETPAGAALDSRISSCFRLDRLEGLVAASAAAPPRFRPYPAGARCRMSWSRPPAKAGQGGRWGEPWGGTLGEWSSRSAGQEASGMPAPPPTRVIAWPHPDADHGFHRCRRCRRSSPWSRFRVRQRTRHPRDQGTRRRNQPHLDQARQHSRPSSIDRFSLRAPGRAMAARDVDAEPDSGIDDSPDTRTAPATARHRSIGLWLVVAALSLWLGVMLFVVGPFSPGSPAEEPVAGPAGAVGAAPGTSPAPLDAGSAGSSSRRSAEPRLIPVSRRDPAPGFALPDMDAGTATLGDYTGRVLLLNFWATWCLPCRAEMPWFVEFETVFGDEGFAVLGVSVDDTGRDIVEPFLERSPVNYRIALADTEARLAPFGPKNVLPTTWLIDRQGRIAAEHVGLVSREAIEAEIRLLLDE